MINKSISDIDFIKQFYSLKVILYRNLCDTFRINEQKLRC